MDILIFAAHLVYIFGTFIAGLALGYLLKDKISESLNKFFKRK